ncbi:TPA: hypothetical protein DCZ46_02505 [Candidatus Campbellbacteria bacterium]|uniref:Uncharacterized protein n=1 Tax=Candidatus Nomurabacteria bacterium GW2011_GWC2_42_20 TaxID=1618756 RepID=A0A0G0ZI87_9BACT|nr:MAG: hypothetical protein UU88_C0003G0059 [Parcubacteria group bacterium GW2011_GWC1_42_11]KKS48394.1 MAG: hypothetical protein UV12_C0001G0089 [Candidatus Nomurabacteria bacterium GW2011_GWC2_42_20]KKS59447.1 MAG: hypothetical protein UV24_C0001G0035 [Candidatus Nomurabacteria bacterium GW2011_GWA2_42_41]KKT09970.1 MAG: hypothetical protein UV86_C0001G0072 [Candidatus Nomurabacteria bacterium GW2011_GWB1_43_20]TAN36050.1 MAG: hypothetical protein EPN27_02515 [Patescibacteria group bacterium
MLPASGSPIIDKIKTEIINPIIILLVAVAVGYFLYGLMEFIRNQDNEDAQESGKKHMLWGAIGIAIMFSVYGILNLVNNIAGSLTT